MKKAGVIGGYDTLVKKFGVEQADKMLFTFGAMGLFRNAQSARALRSLAQKFGGTLEDLFNVMEMTAGEQITLALDDEKAKIMTGDPNAKAGTYTLSLTPEGDSWNLVYYSGRDGQDVKIADSVVNQKFSGTYGGIKFGKDSNAVYARQGDLVEIKGIIDPKSETAQSILNTLNNRGDKKAYNELKEMIKESDTFSVSIKGDEDGNISSISIAREREVKDRVVSEDINVAEKNSRDIDRTGKDIERGTKIQGAPNIIAYGPDTAMSVALTKNTGVYETIFKGDKTTVLTNEISYGKALADDLKSLIQRKLYGAKDAYISGAVGKDTKSTPLKFIVDAEIKAGAEMSTSDQTILNAIYTNFRLIPDYSG